jgi:5'-nucleotidase
MLNWQSIDTVMLDMDGTLLDLHYDNYFWQEYVPACYAEQRHLMIDTAKQQLFPKFKAMEGTMEWYCVDYWSTELQLDIAQLKHQIRHLIAIHPDVKPFLQSVRKSGRQAWLVTNAHHKSLNLKMQQTGLRRYFDHMVCAHDFGLPKEKPQFWKKLSQRTPFEKTRCLFIDDSIPVLKSAQQYGIAQCLAIHKPDSKCPPKDTHRFPALKNFRQIMPE